MAVKIALLLVILSVNGASTIPDVEGSSTHCCEILETFAHAVSNYTLCAVREATPFRFCCRCKHQYLTSLSIGKTIHDECETALILREKHQIIGEMFAFVKKLWTKSNCQHCYSKTGHELTRPVEDFFKTFDTIKHCFFNFTKITPIIPVSNKTNHTFPSNFTGTSAVCKECKTFYSSLQEAYKSVISTIKVTKNGNAESEICGDVSAAMNYTRIQWSNDFKCVTIYKDMVSVLALSCFFCFLPIIFYAGTRFNEGSSQDKSKGRFLKISYDSD